jgi:hypothetical protein
MKTVATASGAVSRYTVRRIDRREMRSFATPWQWFHRPQPPAPVAGPTSTVSDGHDPNGIGLLGEHDCAGEPLHEEAPRQGIG